MLHKIIFVIVILTGIVLAQNVSPIDIDGVEIDPTVNPNDYYSHPLVFERMPDALRDINIFLEDELSRTILEGFLRGDDGLKFTPPNNTTNNTTVSMFPIVIA